MRGVEKTPSEAFQKAAERQMQFRLQARVQELDRQNRVLHAMLAALVRPETDGLFFPNDVLAFCMERVALDMRPAEGTRNDAEEGTESVRGMQVKAREIDPAELEKPRVIAPPHLRNGNG